MSKYLLHITALRFGGAERVMSTLANSLAKKGHEVTLLSLQNTHPVYKLDENVKWRSANIKITPKNKIKKFFIMPIYGIKSFFKYIYIVKEEKPDIILAFLSKAITISILAKCMFFPEIATFISERNDVTRDNKLVKFRKKILFNKVRGIICQSKAVKDYYQSIGIKDNLLSVAWNPIDLSSIYLNTEELKKRKKRIISVGRLSEQKNFSLLIKAIDIIKDEIKDYEILIIGEGELRSSLEKQVEDLGLETMISFLGVVKQPFQQYGDSRLFLMTSIFEGFPNVLIEALASGIPTCTTNFSPGTAHEILENEYILNTFDEKELSKAILDILKKPENLNVKKSKRIIKKFSPDEVTNNWINILEAK